MTVSAPSSPRPGRAAAAGRPAGVLWILLLVGLLTALPCSGRATAADQGPSAPSPVSVATTVTTVTVTSGAGAATAGPATGRSAKATGSADHLHVDGPRHWTWCSADGRPPQRDNGCSSHPYCGQDAQLPNPPPHPQPVLSPHAPAPEPLPRVAPAGLLVGPHPAPDLHALQVHRS